MIAGLLFLPLLMTSGANLPRNETNVMAHAQGPPPGPLSIDSSYRYWPRTVDGAVGWWEWDVTNRIDFDHGFITVLNDNIRLYILVDVLGDTTEGSPSEDYFWLTFDVDRDGAITPDVDLNYGPAPGTYDMQYQYYSGPGSWSGGDPGYIFSSVAAGFGCFFADGTEWLYTAPLAPVCDNHRVYEFGIDLREIGAHAGGDVRMGLRIVSANPDFTDEVPANFTHDFSDLIEVSLAPYPGPLWAVDPTASVGFDERYGKDGIEVTQAIQTRMNDMPLVDDKATVARMYVQTSGATFAQPAIVYLYGTSDGHNLPGSPLSTLFLAPVYDFPSSIPRRDQLDSTANFVLPDSWIEGTVTFRGRAMDLFGHEVASSTVSHTFTPREVPVYWSVPINTGTEEAPNVVNNHHIARQETYLETVYTVPDVEFVRKGWEEVGATGHGCDEVIQKLNDYYDRVQLAWILGLRAVEVEPGYVVIEEAFALPDQIYGFMPRTCTTSTGNPMGMSNPVWLGGRGRVAIGFAGEMTNAEPVMAHEINHNLDRRPDGEATWGLHVGNPDPDTWGISNPNADRSWGCGASGPDPDWPRTDDDINEVGFDTRVPWGARGSDRDTVVPLSCPDFMSYCGRERAPTRWVSPYRWENLFNHAFAAPLAAGLSSHTHQVQQQTQTVYYVSGYLSKNGTGNLNPIFVQPGIPTPDIPPGEYAIEVRDAFGKVLLTKPFFASFVDAEGNAVEETHFRFQLLEQPGASKVFLKKGGQILDGIVVSENAPTVTVMEPNGGEQWTGRQTIVWNAQDQDGDSLRFTILYSPDKGKSWYPVAWSIEGQSYDVDAAILPGGDSARVRVIATDGFNTTQDDTDGTFWVQPKPPDDVGGRPEPDSHYWPGQLIHFEGEAFDVDDGLLPGERFIWSYDSTIFGTGSQVSARLPAGYYEVSLTVVDNDETTGQDTIGILVYDSDINGDGTTNIVDLQQVAAGWGLTPADQEQWNPTLDLNFDQVIGIDDIMLAANRWRCIPGSCG